MTVLDEIDVSQLPREALPALLGRLVELEARIRLRLAEVPATAPAATCRVIDGDAAAAIAGTSKRWLRSETKGMKFRCDLSQKQTRWEEAGLRSWLASRR